jgi:hypothetical protein
MKVFVIRSNTRASTGDNVELTRRLCTGYNGQSDVVQLYSSKVVDYDWTIMTACLFQEGKIKYLAV